MPPKILILIVLSTITGLLAIVIADICWGIYLYQIWYFLNPGSRYWGQMIPDLRYSFIIAVVLFVFFIFRKQQYSETKLMDAPQSKWLLLQLILMGIIYFFFAAWPEKHLGFYISHIKLVLYIAVAYKAIDTPKKFNFMILSFLIGEFYIGWVAHTTGRTAFGRLDGIGPPDGSDANDTGCVLIMAIPILLFYLMNGKRWQQALSLFSMAFILDGIVLVNSRGAFLGLAVGCGYMFLQTLISRQENLGQKYKMIVFAIVGVCAFIYLTDADFWQRMSTIQGDLEGKTGGAQRMYFWSKAYDLARDYPFGVGVWGYQYLSPTFLDEANLSRGMRAVHSMYFQALAEYGFLGWPLLAGLIFPNFLLTRRTKKILRKRNKYFLFNQVIALEAALICFLIASIFLDRLYAEVFYWFMMYTACFWNIFIKNIDIKPHGIE